MKHIHKWIGSIMDNLDEYVDEETKDKVLFESVLERPLKAELERSVVRVDDVCRFGADL